MIRFTLLPPTSIMMQPLIFQSLLVFVAVFFLISTWNDYIHAKVLTQVSEVLTGHNELLAVHNEALHEVARLHTRGHLGSPRGRLAEVSHPVGTLWPPCRCFKPRRGRQTYPAEEKIPAMSTQKHPQGIKRRRGSNTNTCSVFGCKPRQCLGSFFLTAY